MSEFVYRRRVQFAETDLAGIVHFSNIFRYMEEAEHALWRAAGLTIAERGTHAGLLRQDGLYASMWNRQREATEAEEHLKQVRDADELGMVVRQPAAGE